MDHWWVEASGIAERFTSIPPAEYYEEPETFQLELITRDDRSMRIEGDRNILKHARRQMATGQDIRRLGTQIAETISGVTGTDLTINALAFGSERIFREDAPEAGTFWLELRTHDGQTMRIEGDQLLFRYAHPRPVTDRDVRQLGNEIISTINRVTGELELGGTVGI